MQRPSSGEVTLVVFGVVLLIASMLNLWGSYECSTCPADAHRSQVSLWSKGFTVPVKGAILIAGAMLVVVILRVAGVSFPGKAARIYVGGAAMVTLLLVIGLIAGPSDLGFGHTELLQVSRGPMLLIAWLLGLGMLAGGLRHMRETLAAERRPAPGPVVLR